MSVYITTIDTLKFSERMQKAGMQKESANELAEFFKETHEQNLDLIATKKDLQDLRLETKKDIQDLRTEMHQEFKLVRSELRNDIKTSMFTTIISMSAVMALIQKFLN